MWSLPKRFLIILFWLCWKDSGFSVERVLLSYVFNLVLFEKLEMSLCGQHVGDYVLFLFLYLTLTLFLFQFLCPLLQTFFVWINLICSHTSLLCPLPSPAGFEATKWTLYGRQRQTDGGQLYQSQLDRTGLATRQAKDALMLFFTSSVIFITLRPTRAIFSIIELWN